MSRVPSQLPPPSNRHLLPILGAITYIALVVAAWGGLSVVLDREVIEYPDAGPLLGPAIAASAGVVTWLACRQTRRPAPLALRALGAIAAAFGVMVAVGSFGYAIARSSLTVALLAAAQFSVSPFVITAAVVAGATVVASGAFDRGRTGD